MKMPKYGGFDIVAVVNERPGDALVSNRYGSFDELPAGAKVGSSSLRRRLQMQARRPELNYLDVRGNVGTRLQKLDDGEYDAIVLAVAGLKRLELADRITQPMDPSDSTPSAGQGAVGIEARVNDERTLGLLAPINHPDTFDCVTCERVVSTQLGASCGLPIAAATPKVKKFLCERVGGDESRGFTSARAERIELAKDVAGDYR